jgi:glycosyltransferase involved in cell wall biosynthesis
MWSKLARERNWLVVNCHFPDAAAGFWLLLRAMGVWKGSFIVSVHGGEVRGAVRSKDRIGRYLLRKVLIGADMIVACAAGLGADVIALAPEARERVRVIHNGVDFDALAAHVVPDFVLPPELEGKPFILNVATYEPKKSQGALIQAFSITAAQHLDVHLVIIGRDTPWAQTIRDSAAASGFSERIHLLVDLPHAAVINWLSRAAIFCLPSEYEGHPLVIMEAAAFGLPVVATSIPGTQDIITSEDDGLLTPALDHEALAGALNRLIEDPETAARLGRNLRRSVEARYSWARTAQEYSDLGRSLLAGRGDSAGR